MRIWPFQHEERCALQSHVTAPPQVLTRCDHFRKFYDQQFTEKLSYPEHYLRVLKCTKIRSTYTPYTVQRWTPIIIYSAMVGNCSLIPAEYGAFQKNINPLQAASIRGIVTKNSPLISNPSRNKGGILSKGGFLETIPLIVPVFHFFFRGALFTRGQYNYDAYSCLQWFQRLQPAAGVKNCCFTLRKHDFHYIKKIDVSRA